MRKLYLSALPLVLLFAPFYVRLLTPSTRMATEAAAELVSSAERADREFGRQLRTRIENAKQLLAGNPLVAQDVVTLAVEDAAARLHLVSLPKETFLKAGNQAQLLSSLGVPLTVHVVRPNYVNTAVRVLDAAGQELAPLVVKYPLEKGGKLKELAYYTSAHPSVSTPALTREGRRYVREQLDAAAASLAAEGMPIDPALVDAAERLCFVEHVDHGRFKRESRPELLDEIGALYALNAGDTYRYSVSSAGAGGMVQMIPPTYHAIRAQYPRAALNPDFVEGMRDHANATRAMLIYMKDTWGFLARQDEVKTALSTGIATQADLLAAGYNSNPRKLPRYIERGGSAWRTLIPEETKMYLQIYAAVESHIPFESRAARASE
ncbi:MAG TPA: hypothetical protein VK421_13630 [Pyrinomonadaceae bacterium]|nr:hypothetical protein [Pyrinomonadaceae bacterium]